MHAQETGRGHMGEMNAVNGRTWTAVRSMITLVLAPTLAPPHGRSVGRFIPLLAPELEAIGH